MIEVELEKGCRLSSGKDRKPGSDFDSLVHSLQAATP